MKPQGHSFPLLKQGICSTTICPALRNQTQTPLHSEDDYEHKGYCICRSPLPTELF